MKEKIRALALQLADWAASRLPYYPLMGRLGVFRGARATRRYLAGLFGSNPVPQPAPRSKPPLAGSPKCIWYIADVYWEGLELIPELKKICPVHVIDLRSVATLPNSRDAVLELVRRSHGPTPPDLIILYARESLLSEALFLHLRGLNAPIWGMNLDDKVEFFPDDIRPYSGRDGYVRWVSSFDLNLTCAPALVDAYAAAGGQVVYFPEGFHFRPEFEPPRPAIVDRIAFVGAMRDSRARLVRDLGQFGIHVTTYGGGWPGGKMVTEPWRVYRAAQLSLGDGVTPQAHTTNLKPRDFETPGSNTCYITTYNWELAEHFDIGREILCFRNTDELVEMLAYYQARPDECFKIAEAGFARARACHTWEKRFRKVIAERL